MDGLWTHKWQASFGSTAITVLMAFFTSTSKYETQEACEEYTEDQLQECHFIYEDLDNKEQPVAGKVRVDLLAEFGKPGYQTALVLTAMAAEHTLVLVKDQLLIDNNPADNSGKTHKIMQTLNKFSG
ncbi:hypothetical protein BDR04DRAFT_1115819 [Suillus decipiens]|nr:hypothetical protein BDR04DRAFT_1115819 [Suillus decipiens]